MRFKTMRLMTTRNGPKWIISTSDGLMLLEMVSEPDIEWCANEDVGLSMEWIVRSYIG